MKQGGKPAHRVAQAPSPASGLKARLTASVAGEGACATRGAAAYIPRTSADLDDRFSQAILFSAIVHVVFIFGLQFKAANPRLFENPNPPLDVVLVNAKTSNKPIQADVLAQANLDGGGNVEENRQAKSPLPAAKIDQTMSAEQASQARVKALEAQARALMDQLKSNYQTPKPQPQVQAPPQPEVASPAPANLAAKSLEMARLQARIDQQMDEYNKRPRREFVGARAKEYTFAQYVEDWRIKVERIGNLNYPEAARRQGLHGQLILTANVMANGQLESVQIDRSSGSKVLDAAAVRIVEMSAPFAPFTDELRKKVDILGITRTWAFTRSDQFNSQ